MSIILLQVHTHINLAKRNVCSIKRLTLQTRKGHFDTVLWAKTRFHVNAKTDAVKVCQECHFPFKLLSMRNICILRLQTVKTQFRGVLAEPSDQGIPLYLK